MKYDPSPALTKMFVQLKSNHKNCCHASVVWSNIKTDVAVLPKRIELEKLNSTSQFCSLGFGVFHRGQLKADLNLFSIHVCVKLIGSELLKSCNKHKKGNSS